MEKFLRLTLNRLSIILLSSMLFLSIPQQKFPFEATQTVACSETLPAIYPKLNYSTFLGGDDRGDQGRGIAVTDEGSYYVTGQTKSNDFPILNAYDSTHNGSSDAFISKFDENNLLQWSSYFGGNDSEGSLDVAVTNESSCYIIGFTRSSDFPTLKAFNNTYSGSDDAFLAKFAPNGSLLWSTFFGGSNMDFGHSIAVTTDGSCYITGETWSSNFPTKNAYTDVFGGGNTDAFVAKFAPNGSLLWSTFLGGNGNEVGYGLAVTDDGSCFATGITSSNDFPTLNGYDTSPNGDWDVFVTKFSSDGNLLWSSLLGGTGWDEGWGIAVGNDGSYYVTGYTESLNFPTQNAYSSTYDNWGDAFLTKFAENGSLLWSTFLGGNGVDRAYDVAVISNGSCYITGYTGSDNFPVLHAFDDSKAIGFDTFAAKFTSTGSLCWSSYLGGNETDKGYSIAATAEGSCYIVGRTWSAGFPTLDAYDSTASNYGDCFITKFIDTHLPSTPTIPNRAYYGFLAFIIVIPIIVIIIYKKRK